MTDKYSKTLMPKTTIDQKSKKMSLIEEVIVAVDECERIEEEMTIQAACTCTRYGANEDKIKCALGACEVLKVGYQCPRIS
jgi:hypothetical protein